MLTIPANDPVAEAITSAIRAGDVEALRRLFQENGALATARVARSCTGGTAETRALLHIATDWPGHFPNGAATVAVLIAAGADVNARFAGTHTETPLHWAASSDDVEVLDALLDGGADIEATGGVIGDGTPLADAVAFGQWHAARRLVERGARTTLWQAAALGLRDRVEQHCSGHPAPSQDDITKAFWCACDGGQRETAEYLLERGADLNWIGQDGLAPIDAARRSGAEPLVEWLRRRGAKSTRERS